jgi:hypothetical protein
MNTMARVLILTSAVAALGVALAVAQTGMAETPKGRVVYATTQDNRLARFGTENPASSASSLPFDGLMTGETLIGLDFGPRDGKLYGVSDKNRMYTIDPATAKVSPIGSSTFMPGLTGTSFGLDFNPTVNRVRLHADDGFNARLNQETGAVVDFDANTAGIQPDKPLNYASSDAGAGQKPSIVGTAYTNSNATATTTTLYAIDSSRDVLVTVAPPNDGVLSSVGALGVDTSSAVGFDISGAADGTAFATLTTGGSSRLYTVNLMTGKATLVGAIGGNVVLTGIAIAP